ncbi:MAG TPA: Crp/Fnr family transcriptional regulator [Candidatus Saccharimonadales bacterium]|nr:Crp/Fnr family transcriptional regulator [Candidatus Saccharimonadales bacterium]
MEKPNVEELMEDFLQKYPAKTYKKAEIIVFQGEAPRTAYVIKMGIVKAYNLNANGDEKPVAFYADYDVFPRSWAYGIMPSAIYYYEAFSDTIEVYLVPREDYLNFIKSTPAVMYRELEHYVTDQIGKTMRLNALQHSRSSDKLIYTLHYLALSHGRKINPKLVEITLTLTHQDFANLTGLTRETAATELNKLKSHGVIAYGKHTPYQIRLDKLTAMLNDEYIADIKL